MLRVRIHKIESMRDPEGKLGKRIELTEDQVIPQFAVRPATEEARVMQEVVKTLQRQMPMLNVRQFRLPRVILFLTEQEYEELGIHFEVNQIYELELSGQCIRFRKAP